MHCLREWNKNLMNRVLLCMLSCMVAFCLLGCTEGGNSGDGLQKPTAGITPETLTGKETDGKDGKENPKGPDENPDRDTPSGKPVEGEKKQPTGDNPENPANPTGTGDEDAPAEKKLLGEGKMKVVFFDAGHADAFLIYTDNATIVIDTGEKGFGKKISKYLTKIGHPVVDYMFISHFDKDHVGGAAKVIKDNDVFAVYTGSYVKNSDELYDFKEAAEEKGVSVQMVREDMELEIDGIKIQVNVPPRLMYEDDPSNNSSLIIRITHGENVFLFTGDIQNSRIQEYVATNPEPCKVLKVPYHGIFQGAEKELLDVLNPKYAVITSSKDEKEDEETKKLLDHADVKIYKTRKGDVEMTSDGKDLVISH